MGDPFFFLNGKVRAVPDSANLRPMKITPFVLRPLRKPNVEIQVKDDFIKVRLRLVKYLGKQLAVTGSKK